MEEPAQRNARLRATEIPAKPEADVIENPTSETYVPLSRGLDEHLAGLSGNAVKTYIHLLINAAHSGKSKGTYAATFGDIASRLRVHYQTVRRAIAELKGRYIEYTPAKNQYQVSVFRVLKYKTVRDFAVRRGDHSGDSAVSLYEQPPTQQRHSSGSSPQNANDLPAPKKYKKLKKGEVGAKSAPPSFKCSHGDCSNHTYHSGRIVAEAQGLSFPDDVGSLPRWLRESKALTKFNDNDIAEFVEFKIRRESPRWDSQPLRPVYVAEDVAFYLRKRESDVRTKPNGHEETAFWISDRERDGRRKASEKGQTA